MPGQPVTTGVMSAPGMPSAVRAAHLGQAAAVGQLPQSGVQPLVQGVGQLPQGLGQLPQGLGQLPLGQLPQGVGQLPHGLGQLGQGGLGQLGQGQLTTAGQMPGMLAMQGQTTGSPVPGLPGLPGIAASPGLQVQGLTQPPGFQGLPTSPHGIHGIPTAKVVPQIPVSSSSPDSRKRSYDDDLKGGRG